MLRFLGSTLLHLSLSLSVYIYIHNFGISTDNSIYDLNSNFLEEVWIKYIFMWNKTLFCFVFPINDDWHLRIFFIFFLLVLPPIVVLNKAAVVGWCMLYFGKKKYFRGNHFSLNFQRKLTSFTPSFLPTQASLGDLLPFWHMIIDDWLFFFLNIY